MAVVAAMHQAHYMPWLGYFEKLDRCDVFVVMDRVQYERRGYQNRNKIKTVSGPLWLTVPVVNRGRYEQALGDVEIDATVNWPSKHLKAFELNYRKAPHFDTYFPCLEELLLRKQWLLLADLNIEMLKMFMRLLDIRTELRYESDLNVEGVRNERLINLCRAAGADVYLSGAGAKVYVEPEMFEQAGIGLLFQEYESPRYPQLFGDFEPYMGVVDLLMNCGADSIEIIRSGRKDK